MKFREINSFSPLSWGILFFFCCLAQMIVAHPLDMGLVTLNEENQGIRVRFEMNPIAVKNWVGINSETPTEQDFQENLLSLQQETLNKIALIRGGQKCVPQEKAQISLSLPQSVGISQYWECAEQKGPLKMETYFWDKLPKSYEFIVRFYSSKEEHFSSLNTHKPQLQFELKKTASGAGAFIGLGVEHIGVTPSQWWTGQQFRLPDGLDHILFVVALLLCEVSIVSVLKVVTGFTVGHSITLALGVLGFVPFSSRWVESAIAFSIAYVAAQSMVIQKKRDHWKIALGFGLIHGMGFASALTELNLKSSQMLKALLGFNLGVELGQCVIVAMVFPVFYILRQSRVTERIVFNLGGGSIFLMGTYWFIRRAFAF